METRVKSFSQFVDGSTSESLRYHVDRDLSIVESVFRPGSDAHVSLLVEARDLFETGRLRLESIDEALFKETDLGRLGFYEGRFVPLDLVIEDLELNEAEYNGKKVELGKPMRGGSKKYYVYTMNPSTKRVIKIQFGDPGLSAKVSNPKARKSFAARHRCHEKTDRAKAGYWACRINRYAHLWGGKTYPGYW
jgi:hypothetical protein